MKCELCYRKCFKGESGREASLGKNEKGGGALGGWRIDYSFTSLYFLLYFNLKRVLPNSACKDVVFHFVS